jgi:hypothetical protein
MTSASLLYGADNEIYVDQSGATANIDLEQLGNSNIIGGLNSVAGTLTALDLDGLNLTLDINQIGDSNKFLGDILVITSQVSLSLMEIIITSQYKETQQIHME